MRSQKKKVDRVYVRALVGLLRRGISEFEFEEIVAALPETMDLFTDFEVDILLEVVQQHRKDKIKHL